MSASSPALRSIQVHRTVPSSTSLVARPCPVQPSRFSSIRTAPSKGEAAGLSIHALRPAGAGGAGQTTPGPAQPSLDLAPHRAVAARGQAQKRPRPRRLPSGRGEGDDRDGAGGFALISGVAIAVVLVDDFPEPRVVRVR